MQAFNLNDMTQIITIYLIFNFIIAICIIYIILSIIFRYLLKNRKISNNEVYSNRNNNTSKHKKRRKKDIIEFFWEEEPDKKIVTFLKRSFLIAIIVLTIIYIYNSINFIIENIEIVKEVL